MNSWSSFKDDKIIMEAWRSHLDEDVDAKRLAEDLDKELERIDELFGFGKSREDKWKAIAAGEDEEVEDQAHLVLLGPANEPAVVGVQHGPDGVLEALEVVGESDDASACPSPPVAG